MRKLTPEQSVAFALEFKLARATALRDAEAFDQLLFAIERFGSYITRTNDGLADLKRAISQVASQSVFFEDAPRKWPGVHAHFDSLYESVRIGRNDALHQGSVARHLAQNAQELAMVLEDALMSNARTAADVMVRAPICAETWQPLSSIRRTMLLNSFSFLPYQKAMSDWRLISDSSLVTFLGTRVERNKRLIMSLEEAMPAGLKDSRPHLCASTTPIDEIAAAVDDIPYLVMNDKHLLGIITAFDLL
jgi:CBS domain-containing protein